jgi:DNA mismatch repair ATPase MutS
MQPFKKCKSAWSILDRHYEDTQMPSNHVIGNDVMTWQNLQLLRGEQEENRTCYVANLVDRTSTEIGRVALRAWIAQPTDDHKELQKRQSYVKHLVEQKDLFDELNKLMKQFKESENFLLSFWLNDPLKQAADRHYFKLSRIPSLENTLNESVSALTLMSTLEHQRRALTVLTCALAAAVLPAYGLTRLATDPTGSGFDTLAERLVGAGGPLLSLFSFVKNNQVQSASFMGAGFYTAVHTQDEYDWARDNFTITMCLQTKLRHVANCVHALEGIGKLLHAHPELRFAADKDIYTLVQKFTTENPATQKLCSLLKTDTFNGEAAMISNYGRILVAYRLMREHTSDLEPLLCALGELDAYLSIARLYKEFEHERVHYTFASYDTNTDKPTIIFNDLWSPFIDPARVVPNSIALGTAENNRSLIITGPNEGGKSTFIKSVTIGLILGQSIGLVPASHAVITPFSYITTYLNITDDHGKSLFEAQVQRAKHILNHIDSMDTHKFSFAIIDELFNGTSAHVGEAASYSIADYLSKNPYVISIFSTHFPQLTQLEKSGHSINYRVLANLDEKGTIIYPFIVEKGASTQNVALDIMRNEGFNAAILNQTSELIKG